MRRSRALRVALPIVVVIGSLVGCASSPQTTVVDSGGEERTVDWVDHPGDAYTDDAEILSAPTPEEVEEREQRLFAEIEAALTDHYGFQWSERGESGWNEHPGNGYGGESWLVTYNSPTRVSDGVPADKEAWRELLRLIDEVLAEDGFQDLLLHHEAPAFTDSPKAAEELQEWFGTTDPEKFWQWTADALGNSQWVSVTLTNVSEDVTGQADQAHQEDELPGRAVTIDYGATTIPEEERDEFTRAIAPFDGLQKPESTGSD